MSEARADLVATPSQTVGPFFHFGLADKATLGCLVRPDTPGVRISLLHSARGDRGHDPV